MSVDETGDSAQNTSMSVIGIFHQTARAKRYPIQRLCFHFDFKGNLPRRLPSQDGRRRSAMMTFIEHLVNLTVYEFLILGCSAPVVVLLLHFMRGIAGAMVSVVWFVGGLWIAHNAARRRVFGSEGFLEAIGSAVAE